MFGLEWNGMHLVARKQDTTEKVAEQFTEEEIAFWTRAFHQFDTNGDGKIARDEFAAMLRHQNTTEDELKDLIKQLDEDGNGTIEFNEFLVVMAKKMRRMENTIINKTPGRLLRLRGNLCTEQNK